MCTTRPACRNNKCVLYGLKHADHGSKINDQVSRIKDQRSSIKDHGLRIKDHGSWNKDQGSRIKDLGPGMNDHPGRDTNVRSRPSESTIKDLSFFIGFIKIQSSTFKLGVLDQNTGFIRLFIEQIEKHRCSMPRWSPNDPKIKKKQIRKKSFRFKGNSYNFIGSF